MHHKIIQDKVTVLVVLQEVSQMQKLRPILLRVRTDMPAVPQISNYRKSPAASVVQLPQSCCEKLIPDITSQLKRMGGK